MAPRSRRIHEGRAVHLDLERVLLPNGHEVELEIVRHPGGAAVVAVDDGGRICLLRQYRHAAGGWLWELPAGKLDEEEPPLATARRELAEEAGVSAAEWTPLGRMISSPGPRPRRNTANASRCTGSRARRWSHGCWRATSRMPRRSSRCCGRTPGWAALPELPVPAVPHAPPD